jgi:hypothetical protein
VNVNGIDFNSVFFALPTVTDPGSHVLKPIIITNLADYNFVTFDNVDKVTVNPSLVNTTSWNTTVSLSVKLENVLGATETHTQAILVQLICNYPTLMTLDSTKQTAFVFQGPSVLTTFTLPDVTTYLTNPAS